MSRTRENKESIMDKTIVVRCSGELFDEISKLSDQKRRSKQFIVRKMIENQLLQDNPGRNVQL